MLLFTSNLLPAPITIPVPSKAISIVIYVPTISTTVTLPVPGISLTITTYIPTIVVISSVTISVPSTTITLTTYTPTIVNVNTIAVPRVLLGIVSYIPTIIVPFIPVVYPINVLPLQDKITKSLSKQTIDRVRISQYQNGPVEIASDGINGSSDTWTLTFAPLTLSEYTSILVFLNAVGCNLYFKWLAPGDTVEQKWTIEKDSKASRPLSKTHYEVQFTLTQCFDLRV